jgi:acyl transferase domain-containing protein
VEALRQVFHKGAATAQTTQTCALGSVKTNIGHLDSAAGVAGLIKTALCLENRTLVPSLHFERPNPQLDLDHSPFYIGTQTTTWEQAHRLAGVSSFGIGGTNAHLVLGEAPDAAPSGPSRRWQVLTLSANTESALQRKKTDLANFLVAQSDVPLADVAFTLNVGRKTLPVRQSFVCTNTDEALAALSKGKPVHCDSAKSHAVVFLFPGQGKAYTDLGQQLYHEEVRFREEIGRCCKRLVPLIGADLRELLFAKQDAIPEQIHRPLFWQPALFVIEYALAQLWISWGIKPAAMLGHSLGEYVAATLAGVMELNDALALVAERARWTERLEPGAMLAVPMSEAEIHPYIKDRISLASVNSPELCVLAGPVSGIDHVEKELASFNPIRLEASHAFHSALVEPAMEPLTRLASRFKLHPPRIPYLSNVTGTWIRDEEAVDPSYWARHLRGTVRFSKCLEEVKAQPRRILLEVGPGKVLSDLARRNFTNGIAVPSLKPGDAEGRSVAAALGNLWSEGAEVNWRCYYKDEKRRRIPLPTYPFERRSYWPNAGEAAASIVSTPSLTVKDAPENWLYASTWKRAPLARSIRLEEHLATSRSWLVFTDENGISATLAQRLRASGQKVTEVRQGVAFHDDGGGAFTLDPIDPHGYELLLDALQASDNLPQQIIHGWNLDPLSPEHGVSADSLIGFDSLIYLAQVLGTSGTNDRIRLAVLTSNIHRVLDEELSAPAKAAVLGIVNVLPKENPRLLCQNVDVDPLRAKTDGRLQEAIIAEAAAEQLQSIVAYRHKHRWIPAVDRISSPRPAPHHQFRRAGAYLVTHALQELGLALAERLAGDHDVRVVLMDRTFFPQPEDWDNWIAEQGENDPISRKISRLQGIREHVRVITADLADCTRMMQVRSAVERDLGPIHGIFHLERASKTGLIQGKPVPPSTVLRVELAELVSLEQAFKGIGFLALFSSNLAESGGLGQVEQAARNAVLNCFSEYHAEQGKRVLTIELGTRGWRETDEDNPDSGSFIYRQLEEKRQRFGMTLEECLHTVERVLELNLPSVIVSTRDFSALMEQQHLFTTEFFHQQMEKSASRNGASASAHARPEISTSYEPPRNEVEKLLVEIWRSAFRFEQIGVDDNFFELGGHSLLAVQLLKNINETFSSRLALKDLFNAPLIAQLAPLISGTPADDEDAKALEALLAEIEGMSEEKLRAELNSSPEQVKTRATHE